MYKKAWCTCKLVVLRNKPIAFLTSSRPSPSSLLKLPIYSFSVITVPVIFPVPSEDHLLAVESLLSRVWSQAKIKWRNLVKNVTTPRKTLRFLKQNNKVRRLKRDLKPFRVYFSTDKAVQLLKLSKDQTVLLWKQTPTITGLLGKQPWKPTTSLWKSVGQQILL